jgi:hypothetical protein
MRKIHGLSYTISHPRIFFLKVTYMKNSNLSALTQNILSNNTSLFFAIQNASSYEEKLNAIISLKEIIKLYKLNLSICSKQDSITTVEDNSSESSDNSKIIISSSQDTTAATIASYLNLNIGKDCFSKKKEDLEKVIEILTSPHNPSDVEVAAFFNALQNNRAYQITKQHTLIQKSFETKFAKPGHLNLSLYDNPNHYYDFMKLSKFDTAHIDRGTDFHAPILSQNLKTALRFFKFIVSRTQTFFSLTTQYISNTFLKVYNFFSSYYKKTITTPTRFENTTPIEKPSTQSVKYNIEKFLIDYQVLSLAYGLIHKKLNQPFKACVKDYMVRTLSKDANNFDKVTILESIAHTISSKKPSFLLCSDQTHWTGYAIVPTISENASVKLQVFAFDSLNSFHVGKNYNKVIIESIKDFSSKTPGGITYTNQQLRTTYPQQEGNNCGLACASNISDIVRCFESSKGLAKPQDYLDNLTLAHSSRAQNNPKFITSQTLGNEVFNFLRTLPYSETGVDFSNIAHNQISLNMQSISENKKVSTMQVNQNQQAMSSTSLSTQQVNPPIIIDKSNVKSDSKKQPIEMIDLTLDDHDSSRHK